jgi:hypothetical protein
MSVVSQGRESDVPFIGALRRLRDPLLLFVAPVTFAVLSITLGYLHSWPIGFDFRGTLWEPARALLDGGSIYPEPTRAAVVIGNPSVYPPVFILVSVPLALLPVTVAAWIWFWLLALAVLGALRLVGVRDWRCLVLAVTSPVVVHGLTYGNLTLLLLVPLAVAWRYREREVVAGIAIGAAIAAKIFVWPLVVWLVLTRRFAAAAWAVASSAVLVLGAWALVGFDGLADYPHLLRVVQDVYAIRSISIATVAGGLGASVSAAVVVAALAGLAFLGLAAWSVRRDDGDRRAFALVVTACIVASPIVWPNYTALLFVPIAVTWPRLAPAWLFGYGVWLAGVFSPKPVAEDVCCRPADVPPQAWGWSHSDPVLWYAAGVMGVVVLVGLAAALWRRAGATTPDPGRRPLPTTGAEPSTTPG